MSTRFLRISAFALPMFLAAACAGENADDAADAELPAATDTGMYVPPPPPPTTTDTGMMGMDTMGMDTMGADTTGTR